MELEGLFLDTRDSEYSALDMDVCLRLSVLCCIV
jgi:hypothetical protein